MNQVRTCLWRSNHSEDDDQLYDGVWRLFVPRHDVRTSASGLDLQLTRDTIRTAVTMYLSIVDVRE